MSIAQTHAIIQSVNIIPVKECGGITEALLLNNVFHFPPKHLQSFLQLVGTVK